MRDLLYVTRCAHPGGGLQNTHPLRNRVGLKKFSGGYFRITFLGAYRGSSLLFCFSFSFQKILANTHAVSLDKCYTKVL